LIPKKRLGRIEQEVSVISLGGCGVGRISQEEADKVIKSCFDHGVNMIDIAPTYGESELRLAPWMKTHRDKVFLAEKTTKRTKRDAERELHQSLERLGVDKFDLYQLHGIGTLEEVDQVLEPGGAMEAFKEAQEIGLVDYLGITGHQDMRVHLEIIKRFDFDLVLLPVSLCSAADFHPMNDYRPVLKYAEEMDMGVTAIKAICRGRWESEQRYRTWYEPSDNMKDIQLGVDFTLSQNPVANFPTPCDHRLWEMVLEAGENHEPMDEEEQEKAIEYAKEQGFSPLFPE
jgi:aryl-alcohol dehydrogenase-like predicted oxidoreductase